ncbi:MAG: histidinol dehydrogenase [Arenicella sp.]
MNVSIKQLNSIDDDFSDNLAELLHRDTAEQRNIDDQVEAIIAQVRQNGDDALCEFSAKFDQYVVESVSALEVTKDQLEKAASNIDVAQFSALTFAAERVKQYHEKQLQSSWEYEESDGTRLGQKITPLKRAGLYVPGGKAAYPSSVLMTAIPAKVAGVEELVMMAPTPNGEVNDMVLAAAHLAGVDRVFCIGGAHAIAALAYGTQTVPAVDTIVGPGNIYVATAKKLVFGQVGIDMIAGPSEVLIVADETANPDWIAMDLFAQAEHDEMAQSIVLATDSTVLKAIEASIQKLLPEMERQDIIHASLQKNGGMILATSTENALEIIDEIAPEHLELMIADARNLAGKVRNAGAIFIGRYSSESLGDYVAGPSHVLPTSGTARFSSPLGVYDFQKRTSIIDCSFEGAQTLGEAASVLARGEALTAHARSAEMRLKKVRS